MIPQKTSVTGTETFKVTYVTQSALFGMLKWEEVLNATSVGRDIHVFCDAPINHVEIHQNGKRFTFTMPAPSTVEKEGNK